MSTLLQAKKETPVQHDILDVIKDRWSPRSFSDQEVSQEQLNKLFEASRWAPSAMNEQPWRFLVAKKGEEAHQKILDSLMPGNQPWAKNAPVLVASLVKKTYTNSGTPNHAAHHDLGLAIGNMSAQATHDDLAMHQMVGFHKSKIMDSFEIPSDYEPVTVIAIGYHGDPDQLTEDLKARELAPRSRKQLEEIVYYGNFK